ncbi:MAG: penicillin-binding protein, partial [Micromonosporaceae bacterium]
MGTGRGGESANSRRRGLAEARRYTPRGRTVRELGDERRAGRSADPFRPALEVVKGGRATGTGARRSTTRATGGRTATGQGSTTRAAAVRAVAGRAGASRTATGRASAGRAATGRAAPGRT